MSKRPEVLLGLILLLAAAAVALLVVHSALRPEDEQRAAQFHRLVGGLGLGPALDVARCPGSFDPRLCSACGYDLGPIPGGRRFCPHHAGAIFQPTPPRY